jgi:hypothetical protein
MDVRVRLGMTVAVLAFVLVRMAVNRPVGVRVLVRVPRAGRV